MKVTKETIIGKLLEKHPSAAMIMFEHGLGCAGCPSKASETIEAGCRMHGFDEKGIENLVSELNKSIEERKRIPEEIFLTDSAVKKLKSLLKGEKAGTGLHVSVSPGGCAGFMYELSLSQKKDDDVVLSDKGIQIFITKKALQLLKGSKIDYEKEGFRISNS